ncbi:MAG TPA: hypothetical protein VFA04_13755 [Bryobacteraceae bacterium]|nr:hypothetical protein [Bryobacteraceae bacterium]
MSHLVVLFVLVVAPLTVRADDSALDIIRKSVLVDQANNERAKDYTYIEREDERKLDSNGAMHSTGSKTYETVFLYGRPFRRLIARDGKPLSERDAKKEAERFDREVEKRRNESDKQRQKALAEAEKERKEARKFLTDIADAYNFRLVGDEQVSGRDCWVIVAEPKPGYKPHDSESKNLTKLHGRVWIDKDGYHWVKAQAEVLETLSWGMFIARLSPGSRMEFEQTRVNGEVWLPRRMLFHLNARLMFKKMDAEFESDWSGYRKFATESKIVSGAESN